MLVMNVTHVFSGTVLNTKNPKHLAILKFTKLTLEYRRVNQKLQVILISRMMSFQELPSKVILFPMLYLVR